MQTKQRLQGEVKWFNIAKGFGFITSQNVETDIFVHYQKMLVH